jgi:hypothetical protein
VLPGPHMLMHVCWPVMQDYQERVDDANEKLSSVHDLHNKSENLRVKQQTLAKQNGDAYARFVVCALAGLWSPRHVVLLSLQQQLVWTLARLRESPAQSRWNEEDEGEPSDQLQGYLDGADQKVACPC